MPEQAPASEYPLEAALKPGCDALRDELGAIEKRVRALLPQGSPRNYEWLAGHPGFQEWMAGRSGSISGDALAEVQDHQMLAVRAIEDARMRLGKMLQYARDGVSVYDKPTP